MPGLQGEHAVVALGCPAKKSKLSLKFFHKKETKRALDFSESQTEESRTSDISKSTASTFDEADPGPSQCPASPGQLLPCEKRENLVPFVGLSNLGNTCYLNSILQVLYYCPGFIEGVKMMYNLSRKKDKSTVEPEETCDASEALPPHIELLGSFSSLITSVEQLQSSFLLNPNSLSKAELAATPRKILHTLRRLNPMYEGFLQHDAQEVLQCILGYVQEACDTIRKEQELEVDKATAIKTENINDCKSSGSLSELKPPLEEDLQLGKRKSDTEEGNAKKKKKSVKSKETDHDKEILIGKAPVTRSKRKSSKDLMSDSVQMTEAKEKGKKSSNTDTGSGEKNKGEKVSEKFGGKLKRKAALGRIKLPSNQQSIFSKFCSVGKIRSSFGKSQSELEQDEGQTDKQRKETAREPSLHNTDEDKKITKPHGDLDLMQRLFQGRLVLRTRCLECESFTERKENFQDISVPVLDEQPSEPENLPQVSPDPKPELKTLKWAIGQFASVERIVGEDKYFCETCHHYAEAERSLLFDKTPEVITIHLKRFSASSLESDPYAGLSKVNTPLQTPLTLSLEEWCTNSMSSENQRYQLFAVVMHSGVTISSGHYTAFIRMSDLKEAKLSTQVRRDAKQDDAGSVTEEAQVKDEAPGYDDGEVSFKLNAGQQRCGGLVGRKSGSKKLSEGNVGLLGGQRSVSSCELGNGKHPEKTDPRENDEKTTHRSKRRKTVGTSGQNAEMAVKKESGQESEATCGGERQALSTLQEFEGKWLLFDDSEVCVFEEEDFLRACSPDTCSSSTPYLLFYRRKPESQQ
ncbi:ubiquitin carboxyl-terminal hydrolase 1 [Salarias fasciatus]|uniref:Ubiquitin carboxyl-terminal hydrolase n=1 Tax=Salarias fasciatus TaxID=181472 RepID=A0A672J930_SALFA|nr:ubiquitin carboxyl-terminal hydrolase 1 [Salarias fasciatus]